MRKGVGRGKQGGGGRWGGRETGGGSRGREVEREGVGGRGRGREVEREGEGERRGGGRHRGGGGREGGGGRRRGRGRGRERHTKKMKADARKLTQGKLGGKYLGLRVILVTFSVNLKVRLQKFLF